MHRGWIWGGFSGLWAAVCIPVELLRRGRLGEGGAVIFSEPRGWGVAGVRMGREGGMVGRSQIGGAIVGQEGGCGGGSGCGEK